MSTQIGNLHVGLGLDASGLQAGLARATAGIEGFADRMNKRIGGLGALPGISRVQGALAAAGAGLAAAAGVASGAAVAAMGGLSVAAMNTAKELQNMSRVANATPEEFQRIAYAAGQVGISQEKMADILKDVNDRVGDFIATGGGPMKDFFERIAPQVGVTAEQFRKLSGPQALQLYVSSLEKANVNQQDFTFFMEAMASDSTALVPILRNGGKAAQDYGARLEALGGVMDNRTVASLARMKRSMDEVWIVVRGMGMTIGAAFAPVLEAMSTAFVSAGMKGGVLRAAFDGIVTVISHLAQGLAGVIFVVSSLVNGIWSAISAGAEWIGNLTGVSDLLGTILAYSPIGWIAWISGVVKATGGWGEALSALKDLALEVWDRMGLGLEVVARHVSAAASGLKAVFAEAFAWVMRKVADLTASVAGAINGLFAKAGIDLGLEGGLGAELASSLEGYAADERLVASRQKDAAEQISKEMMAPLASLEALRGKTEEVDGSLKALGGAGGGLAAVADGGSKSKEKLSALEKVMASLREEAERLGATAGMTDLEAKIWGKQREAGVEAASLQGQQIDGLMRQIDGLEQLIVAADNGRDAMKDLFGSALDGIEGFRKGLSNLFAEMAKAQFTKGMMGWLGSTSWGGGLMEGIGKILSFDGGGYTWDGPRSGGIDGRGGRLSILHPQETVIDHSRGQGFGGSRISVEAVPNPYFDLRVSQISQAGDQRMATASRRALPGHINDLQARGTR